MKDLFNPDNPFMQFLSRVGEMILANFLFLLCSLPVVTAGAALTALHKVTQNIAEDTDDGVLRTFFRAFRRDWKQATAAWLLMLVFYAGMGCNLLLALSYLQGAALTVCKAIIGVLCVIVLAVGAYLFPLIARYENTLKEHFVNAGVLALVKLPRTLAMAVLNALPLILAYVSMKVFVSTLVFWLTLGFAFVCYIAAWLLMPVFREMEKPGGPYFRPMT